MISLKGYGLTLEEMRAILYQNEEVMLEKKAIEAVIKSRKAVEKIVKERRTVYGINTGFGKFSDVSIEEGRCSCTSTSSYSFACLWYRSTF